MNSPIELFKQKTRNLFVNIKSTFLLKKIFNILSKQKLLKIIIENKNLQHRIKINANDYIKFSRIYSSIKIEITPAHRKYGKFININEADEKKYFHIYFNDDKEEIKKNNLKEEDKVKKIKIIIDYHVKFFAHLFEECECIESIKFEQFFRNNFDEMNCMFCGCKYLKQLNFSSFNTDNIINMCYMFSKCSSLEKLNLDKFNTEKVTNMSGMFEDCSELKKLNLSGFRTLNVRDMGGMFFNCKKLEELNISNFNTYNVTNMSLMFNGCSSLKELNLDNFIFINVIFINNMFSGCSNDLQLKIRETYEHMDDDAFDYSVLYN